MTTPIKGLAMPAQLAGYTVVEQIYEGSRTLVYRAVQPDTQCPVVIKVLRNEHPSFSELVQFRNQYAIAQNLDIPGIVQPLGLAPHHNGYALVMEDFGGISLRQFTQGKPLTVNQFFPIALQITGILHQLHQQRIIHKDIKSANILIHPDSQEVKLIDFSIASLLPRETQEIQNPSGLEGTLAYLSPEQTGRMNRGIDYRSDFYSLGVTFFELLVGELPFQSNDPMELLHCHLAKHPHSVCDAKPDLPIILGEIIRKLMAKNAEDRYQSALGLKHDLMRCQEECDVAGHHAWFNLGERDMCDRFLVPEKLYGREEEVRTLLDAFGRVSKGSSELMLVAGFSGIGKTAVVNEVHKPITRQRGYFIKGKYDQFNRDIPFSAFVQSLQDLIGQILSESDVQLAQWRNQILAVVGENGQVLIEVIPELAQVIGEQPAAPKLTGDAAQNRFNRLFQAFIKIFSTADHPLVMFLDDLQWADSASLQLIKLLLQDNGYLLMLGAYRDNEVSPTHPFMLTVADLEKTQAVVNTITLESLAFEHVNALTADTLICSEELAVPLSQLLDRKTQGNPFFMTQFLKGLHQDAYIRFNQEQRHWECDITQIKTLSLTDDVVEFMTIQLQKLPDETQQALKLAACIGNQFDLETLTIIQEQAGSESAANLWKALQDGLIVPTSQVYKFFQSDVSKTPQQAAVNPTYRFLHDRVQQAAYGLISTTDRTAIHYRIGRLLLEHCSFANAGERIFDIVGHLNAAVDKVVDPAERIELAQLNLAAGQKSKASTAYGPALNYLSAGIDLLPDNVWQQHYDLALDLYGTAAEAACLGGNFEQMEQHSAVVLKHARKLLDTIDVQQVRITGIWTQGHFTDAIQLGLKVLATLGITLPQQPTQADVDKAVSATYQLWAEGSPLDLTALPTMTNVNYLAAMQMMRWLVPSTYIVDPNLMALLILKQVTLSIRYGNCPVSVYSYADYGVVLCGIAEDIPSGYDFGQLALRLYEQLQATPTKCRAWYIIYTYIQHWKESLQTSVSSLREASRNGLEMGDFDTASLNAAASCCYAYHVGQELVSLSKEIESYTQMVEQLKQTAPQQFLASYHQTIHNLLGNAEDPTSLTGSILEQDKFLSEIKKINNRTALFYFYCNKTFLSYLFGKYEQAAADANLAEQHLDGGTGAFQVPLHFFYDALIQLERCRAAAQIEQHQLLAKVDADRNKLQQWAALAPCNHQHRWELIEAERQAVLGNRMGAVDYYDRAVTIAQENGFIQDEALANELAAKFYLDWSKERIAQEYMIEAYYGYARWGAKAKLADLEIRYPQLLAPILQQQVSPFSINETVFATGTNTSTGKSSSSMMDSLDRAAVLKASQIISSEIELEKLLSSLLTLVIKEAGASKSVLMLFRDNSLLVKGLVTSETEPVVLQSILVEESQDVPLKLIHKVEHQKQATVLFDATLDPCLANDPYIVRQQPKSILCNPIVHQGKLKGILYLENELVVGAFTKDRVELLNLLCTQAAISLENARLYQQAQEYAQQLEESQLQIVQNEKMATLGNLVAGVAHEINNPVSFLNGSINNVKDYVQDLFEHLEAYQAQQPSNHTVQESAEDINLDFLVQDLPKVLDSMQGATDRIKGISTSLRTFSRADTEHKISANLHEGLDSTLLILKYRLEANDQRPAIEVIKDYGDLPEIDCFPGQLNQVFMNILANAIDMFNEMAQKTTYGDLKDDPQQITIQTMKLAKQDLVEIRILDNGEGMTEEIKSRIFDHLFTTKGVGKGTGLGLAIAHQIVTETHNGQLMVESSPGQGSMFIIHLPIAG
ncbi:trifunctional serine/threonine-protein kinase/ATP-binding protein/sensor histidine kinase [Almyronema epifaneia]|uniref:histidine kinase n=1 Tax=Almyronema epifaneia S1 TaxID=2991925 RepID=A0ABW6IDT8_9CYAN